MLESKDSLTSPQELPLPLLLLLLPLLAVKTPLLLLLGELSLAFFFLLLAGFVMNPPVALPDGGGPSHGEGPLHGGLKCGGGGGAATAVEPRGGRGEAPSKCHSAILLLNLPPWEVILELGSLLWLGGVHELWLCGHDDCKSGVVAVHGGEDDDGEGVVMDLESN